MNVGKFISKFYSIPVFLSFFIIFSSFSPVHKFYLSLSEIKWNTKEKTMSVSCKLFTDDLEDALLKLYKQKIDLSKSIDNREVEKLLSMYFQSRFMVFVAGKKVDLQFIGFEFEQDAVWCYMESPKVNGKGSIRIENSILYDFLPDQTNMLNVFCNGDRKSSKMSNPDKISSFEF